MRLLAHAAVAVLAGAIAAAPATETENLGLRVLPAAPAPTIDGDAADWDLSGGLFGCGDVENQRDRYAFWAHAAYDAENLYLLVRFVDPTPLDNPGQVEGDYGFAGDSVQFRAIVGDRVSHWTCWRGRDGKHVMNVAYGVNLDQGTLKDAQTKGARQAFAVRADRLGYAQEMAIPWALLAPEGWKAQAGATFRLTFEPNFTVGGSGRLSVKDLFAADAPIDRVFTFMNDASWGTATLAKTAPVEPAPVRLSDKREFAVHLEHGVPVVDWTGLIRERVPTGHETIAFDMPFDGYVSLNLFAPDGTVARQLLTTAFYARGHHEVRWDGLTTPSWRDPGDPVPAGTYTWQALVHPGLHLELVGWAANAGAAPWDGHDGRDNWGGDEGDPAAAAVSGDRVLLGWDFAEAGKSLVAVDADAHVQWRHNREGMSGCGDVAADGRYVYGVNAHKYLFRLVAADASYAVWPGRDTPDLHLHDLLDEAGRKAIPDQIDAIAARDGALYLACAGADAVLVVDGETGALRAKLTVPKPVALAAAADGVLYATSDHQGIVAIDLATGTTRAFAEADDVWGLAVDGEGSVYASLRGDEQRVAVFDRAGHRARSIGRDGGRPHRGAWVGDGMREPRGLAVDAKGRLWVAEEFAAPRRFSVWDARSGAFVRELFGPTHYGALGGSISPKDPLIMAGLGCEWRIDAKTGRADCIAVIDETGFGASRFALAPSGREYLFTAANWAFDRAPLKVYEHLGPGTWKLRSVISYVDDAGQPVAKDEGTHVATATQLWADRNDDGREDADEIVRVPGVIRVSGWHMGVTPELALYAGARQYRVAGFTACGAPTWDLAHPTTMPAAGLGSADGALVLSGGDYGVAHGRMRCFDIATGKQRWWYPDTFVGVHGSHNAPPAEVGLIRGSFSMDNVNAVGVVQLPAPIGSTWVIATNVGEWHLMTERGFYLGRLFEPDPLKVAFPDQAVPGASLDAAPCGMGGEDFGGSATLAADGTLHIEAGKTGFWNVIVRGLDQVRELAGGTITVAASDIALAQQAKERALQEVTGAQRAVVVRATPTFTGDLAKDFPTAKPVTFEKSPGSRVRAAVAYDDRALHVAWEVQDNTPWTNSARSPDALYLGGDTVDLQLATDPAAPADRSEAAKGDVRISIGRCAGKDVAVAFRKVADAKHPRTFSSGVVHEYVMDSVTTLDDAVIAVAVHGDRYVVEASIPLADLGVAPHAGLRLKADLGATFGDPAGQRTRLRSFWSNQHTGIVDDAVYELVMEPRYWGEFTFE